METSSPQPGFWSGQHCLQKEWDAIQKTKDFEHIGKLAVSFLEHYSGQLHRDQLVELHQMLRKSPKDHLPPELLEGQKILSFPRFNAKYRAVQLPRTEVRTATARVFVGTPQTETEYHLPGP